MSLDELSTSAVGISPPHDAHTGSADFGPPPEDTQAEMSVLGGMLIGEHVIEDVANVIDYRDFYQPRHGIIFAAITQLYLGGDPVDSISVGNYLHIAGDLPKVGGQAYLHQLVESVPLAANAPYYAKIVSDRAALRRLVEAGTRIVQMGYARHGGDVDDLISAAEAEVGQVARNQSVEVTSLAETIEDTMDWAASAITAPSTPWPSLTRLIGGFEPGRLYTLLGMPGGMKSAALGQIAMHSLMVHGRPFSISSAEMSRHELNIRCLTFVSQISGKKLKKPASLTPYQVGEVKQAIDRIKKMPPLWIDDRSNQTVEMVSKFARSCKGMDKNLGGHGVDYIQLLHPSSGPGMKDHNREQQVAHQSRQLKMISKSLEIPVIALAQMNRGGSGKPGLGRARESAAIENDSDFLGFLHRELDPDTNQAVGDVEFIVAKSRGTETGTFYLLPDGARMRLTEQFHGEESLPDPGVDQHRAFQYGV